ncbi:hypothetical protein BHS06_15005 [Myxococcus xanthus]|uniref:hypothetical protein n=1 Tax=Myxococcus xanthus TaxID=34 RepID=UPI00112793C6|nr:hypothetical protein [Myxococcus xanthus]QDE90163.1 hypothetical protein BHS06_15005 [Myxococcus xanthus]
MSTPLTEEKLSAIRERHTTASRGPWYWSGYTRGQQLGLHGPRMSSVMEFWRWGMQSAQPVFCVDGILRDVSELAAPDTNPQRGRITAINHPDARFIASSWEDVRDLLAHVAALESAVATPPPELLEAVGREFATLKDRTQFRQVLALDADALDASMGIPAVQWTHLLTWLERRIRSAVDAPKHEEPRPVANCGHTNAVDGLCTHPDNMTPECHEFACPLLRQEPRTHARIATTPVPTVPALVERAGKDGAQ